MEYQQRHEQIRALVARLQPLEAALGVQALRQPTAPQTGTSRPTRCPHLARGLNERESGHVTLGGTRQEK
jgi:hypothetical protein